MVHAAIVSNVDGRRDIFVMPMYGIVANSVMKSHIRDTVNRPSLRAVFSSVAKIFSKIAPIANMGNAVRRKYIIVECSW